MKSILIICASTRNENQAKMLEENIKWAHDTNPNSDILIIIDGSNPKCSVKFPEYCKIEESYSKESGELNAYAWSALHYKEYDYFIFIHDSVRLYKELPLDFSDGIVFKTLWFANNSIDHGTKGKECDDILNVFTINNEAGKLTSIVNNTVRQKRGDLSFGCMGVWTASFAEFLANKTSFLEHCKLFNTRILRCFFERFLCCLVFQIQDPTNYRTQSLCGNIFSNINAFKNSSFDFQFANNEYAVKTWHGR